MLVEINQVHKLKRFKDVDMGRSSLAHFRKNSTKFERFKNMYLQVSE